MLCVHDTQLGHWWSRRLPSSSPSSSSSSSLSGDLPGTSDSLKGDDYPVSCCWNQSASAAMVMLASNRVAVVDRTLSVLPVASPTPRTAAAASQALASLVTTAELAAWNSKTPFHLPTPVSGSSLPSVPRASHGPVRVGGAVQHTAVPCRPTPPSLHAMSVPVDSHMSAEPHSCAFIAAGSGNTAVGNHVQPQSTDRPLQSPGLFAAWEPTGTAQLARSSAPQGVRAGTAATADGRPPAISTAPHHPSGDGGVGGNNWAVQGVKCAVVSSSGAMGVCAVDVHASRGLGLYRPAIVQQHLAFHRILDAVKVRALVPSLCPALSWPPVVVVLLLLGPVAC